jgi:branched-subunit amino acid aminotransferase/4-amino-4-deoxychorismate lyase
LDQKNNGTNFCLINGKPTSNISHQDRGLNYGDGLFETIAVSNNQAEFWHCHLQRLNYGCDKLNIARPNPQLLHDEAKTLIGKQVSASLKIIITRGNSERGYKINQHNPPTRILSISPPSSSRLSENADFLQNKAKFGEKAQFTGVNEHFEPNFNAVLEERCVLGQTTRRLSENADFLQNKAKFGEKAQFTGVNEHFEPNFNAVLEERCVLGQPPTPNPAPLKHIQLTQCSTKLAHSCLAGIKHLNRLEQVLGRNEWDDADFSEGLMQDHHGFFIEGVMSNFFIIKNQIFYTPDLSHCGVSGVMRSVVMWLIEHLKYSLVITQLTEKDIRDADEIFMCNCLMPIWSVEKFNHKTYQHSITTQLMHHFQQINKYKNSYQWKR